MADRIDQITLGSSNYDIDLPVDNRIQKYTAHYLTTTGTAANTTSGSYYHARWDATWDETPYAWSVIDNDSSMGEAAKIEAYDALLYDGLCIHIRVPIAGNGTYGTGLKIGNGKYHPVVYNVNSMISTRYAVNSTIELIYNSNTSGTLYINNTSTTVSGVWQAMDYDSNTTTTYGTIDYYFRPYVGANRLTRYKLVAQDKDNRIIPITTEQYLGDYSSSTSYAKDEVVTVSGVFYKSLQASNKNHAPASNAAWWTAITPFTPNTTPFRPDKIWFFNTTTTYNASSVTGGQVLTSVGYSNYGGSYNFYGGINSTSAGIPSYRMVYLCGTYDKTTGLFTLDTTSNTSYYTIVPDNTTSITLSSYFTSGKDYILVGSTYSSNNYLQLFMVNTLFHFDGTNLVPYDKMSLTASDIDDLGFVRNGNGQSIAESQVTNLVSDLSALVADISSVREVAAGKTKTYVVSDASVSGYSNASLNSQDATVEITSKLKSVGNTDINLADLKVGDNIYVTEVNVPDRWVSSITKSGSTVTKIALSKLETAKCHVQDVTYDGSSIVGNDGVAVVPVYTDHNQTIKSGSTTFGADATINIIADNTNFVTVTPSSNTITIGSPLTIQTAYTWSSDGLTVPNITTNTKGQVTAIYDQSIDFSGCAKAANDLTTIDLGSSSSGTLTTAQLDLAKSKKGQVAFKWGNYFFYGENFTSSSTYYWSCPVWYSGSSIVKRVITLTTSSGAWSESEYTYSPTLTWRNVKVNGSEILGTATNTGALDLKAGNNISLSNSSGEVTISTDSIVGTIDGFYITSDGNTIKKKVSTSILNAAGGTPIKVGTILSNSLFEGIVFYNDFGDPSFSELSYTTVNNIPMHVFLTGNDGNFNETVLAAANLSSLNLGYVLFSYGLTKLDKTDKGLQVIYATQDGSMTLNNVTITWKSGWNNLDTNNVFHYYNPDSNNAVIVTSVDTSGLESANIHIAYIYSAYVSGLTEHSELALKKDIIDDYKDLKNDPIIVADESTVFEEGKYYLKSAGTSLAPFAVGSTIHNGDKVYFNTSDEDAILAILQGLTYHDGEAKILDTSDSSCEILAQTDGNGIYSITVKDNNTNNNLSAYITGVNLIYCNADTYSSMGISQGFNDLADDGSYTFVLNSDVTVDAADSTTNGIIFGSGFTEKKTLVPFTADSHLVMNSSTCTRFYVDTTKSSELDTYLASLTYEHDSGSTYACPLIYYGDGLGFWAYTDSTNSKYGVFLEGIGTTFIYSTSAGTITGDGLIQGDQTVTKGYQNLDENDSIPWFPQEFWSEGTFDSAFAYNDYTGEWNGKFFGCGIKSALPTLYLYEDSTFKKVLVEGDAAGATIVDLGTISSISQYGTSVTITKTQYDQLQELGTLLKFTYAIDGHDYDIILTRNSESVVTDNSVTMNNVSYGTVFNGVEFIFGASYVPSGVAAGVYGTIQATPFAKSSHTHSEYLTPSTTYNTSTTGSEAVTINGSSLNVVTRDTAQTISGSKTLSAADNYISSCGFSSSNNLLGSSCAAAMRGLSSNPFFGLRCNGTNYYLQATSTGLYLGPTSSVATSWATNGDMTIRGTNRPNWNGSNLALSSDLHSHSNKTALDGFAVTSTSVTDGTNTFNKYTHPTTTAVTAGLYKVGKDSNGHVVLGDSFTIPSDYLKLDGTNTMTGVLNLKASGNNETNIGDNGIRWGSTSLPEQTSPQYFCVIDGFAAGGRQKWSGISSVKSSLGIPTFSAAGNRASGNGVTAAAAGQINSEKYAVTSSGTVKATMQYDSTTESIQFIFS